MLQQADYQFCDDIIFEILTRVPLETLGMCRAVSRQWNRVTNEPRFRDLHHRRTQTFAGYFLQDLFPTLMPTFVPADRETPHDNDMSLRFLPRSKTVKIAACDHGILLCFCKNRRICYVCKPSTKEWVKIPDPESQWRSTDITSMAVVRSSKPNHLHFKILRVSLMCYIESDHKKLQCDIFDSRDWAWKRLTDMVIPCDYVFGCDKPVVVGGRAFWLEQHGHVFMFDMYEETWRILPASVPVFESWYRLRPRLLNYEGKLGLLLIGNDGYMELSVMEDLRDPIIWKERNNVCLEGVGCPLELYGVNVRWVYVCLGEEAFRFKVGGSRPHGTGKKFEEQKDVIVDKVFPFYSDYEPSNLRAPSRYSRWISLCPFMRL